MKLPPLKPIIITSLPVFASVFIAATLVWRFGTPKLAMPFVLGIIAGGLVDLDNRLTGRLKNARFTPVLSKAAEGWQGEKGYVQTAAAKDYPDLSGYEVYACGSVAMTESAKSALTAQCSLPETTFYSDAFSPAQ
mgnify:FL=1